MLKASDLITYLNTNWNIFVIPKPEMREGRIDETSRKFPSIYVRVGSATTNPASINSTSVIVSTPFEIESIGKSDQDITDLVNEVYRMMHTRHGDGYWTRCTSHRPNEYSDRRKSIIISGSETKFAIVANGV